MSEDDHYLWEKTGEPDPDVHALERLLSPLGHRTQETRQTQQTQETQETYEAPPALARGTPWTRYAAAAAILVALGGGVLYLTTRPGTHPTSPDQPAPEAGLPTTRPGARSTPPDVPVPAAETALRVVAGASSVAPGSWIRATDAARDVSLGSVGDLRLDPGSNLRLDAVGADAARFFLERGKMEARISAGVKPRFFQVDTSAARCVDLGCRYTLAVDDEGVARVRVWTGEVSFETGSREVIVPRDAVCVARPKTGPGTPRHVDASPALASALDAFDAATAAPPTARRALAAAVLDAVESSRDTLCAWHRLADADVEVERAAEKTLEARAGRPAGLSTKPGERIGSGDRELWKGHLEHGWR